MQCQDFKVLTKIVETKQTLSEIDVSLVFDVSNVLPQNIVPKNVATCRDIAQAPSDVLLNRQLRLGQSRLGKIYEIKCCGAGRRKPNLVNNFEGWAKNMVRSRALTSSK